MLLLESLDLSPVEVKDRLRRKGLGDLEVHLLSDCELDKVREGVEVVIAKQHVLGKPELEDFPNVQMVSLAFTGYDDVDLEYLANKVDTQGNSKPIAAYYAAGYSTESVAEMTVLGALDTLHRAGYAASRLEAGKWNRNEPTQPPVLPGLQLTGKTVGIIGTGTIGMMAARRFRGFDCELLGWSRTKKPEFAALGGKYVEDVDDVFRSADVVSLHLQLIPGVTEHIADARRLSIMKPEAVLLNTARTGLVDLKALTEAVHAQTIWGAALDVTKETHLNPWLEASIPNLRIFPHIGFQTKEALKELARVVTDNIVRFYKGDSTNRIPN